MGILSHKGKYDSNKHLEAKNPQGRYYQRIFQLSNPLLHGEIILQKGRIILDKEEPVVNKEKKISSLKLGGDKILPQEGRRGLGEPNPIRRKDPPLGKVSNSNYSCSLLLHDTFCLLNHRRGGRPTVAGTPIFCGFTLRC